MCEKGCFYVRENNPKTVLVRQEGKWENVVTQHTNTAEEYKNAHSKNITRGDHTKNIFSFRFAKPDHVLPCASSDQCRILPGSWKVKKSRFMQSPRKLA